MKTAIAADMTVIAGDINEMKREGENIAKTVIVETDVTEPDGGGCKNQELLVLRGICSEVSGVASVVLSLRMGVSSPKLLRSRLKLLMKRLIKEAEVLLRYMSRVRRVRLP